MKPFTWSYSRLKNFETCAHRSNEIDNLKHFQEDGKELLWGNEVHAALAGAVGGTDTTKIAQDSMKPYQGLPGVVKGWGEAHRGQVFVEQKYALTRQLTATPYFDKDRSNPQAWFRGICDVAIICPPHALAIDYKTGKVLHDGVQLFLMAACIMAEFPNVDSVATRFIWLKHGSTSRDLYKRSQLRDLWTPILDRVRQMEDAYSSGMFPKTPSGLCRKYCPVTTCEFNGRFIKQP